MKPHRGFDHIDLLAAQERLASVVKRTPLEPFDAGDPRIELRLKLECLQEVGAFKARGAWNQIAQLSEQERAAGVVTTSSGNHGKALAWAAQRAGVRACIVMPANSYPNKIQACREHGAEVLLFETRAECEAECQRQVEAGMVLVHPYDAARTIEGAGTCGLEIAQDWPQVEVVLVPCGGGGLTAGVALALSRSLDPRPLVIAVEPEQAPTLTRGLEAGQPVTPPNTSAIQGLCPPAAGRLNIAIAQACVDHVILLSDQAILAAQEVLVNRGGWAVEPAGAATTAALLSGALQACLAGLGIDLALRGPRQPLRVVAIVSGGNPDPAQLAQVRAKAVGAAR